MNIETKLRRAGLITGAGLLVQFLSLLPLHPLAFLVFVGIGIPLTLLGVVLYLLSLMDHHEAQEQNQQ